jgi:hypothetical protein
MSNKVYLSINNIVLPVEPHRGYDMSLKDADNVAETEAGTYIRSVYRSGIPKISVKFWCDLAMLQQLHTFRNEPSVLVRYFDPLAEANSDGDRLVSEYMYVSGYKESMKADTDDLGIWEVSFGLEDLSYV